MALKVKRTTTSTELKDAPESVETVEQIEQGATQEVETRAEVETIDHDAQDANEEQAEPAAAADPEPEAKSEQADAQTDHAEPSTGTAVATRTANQQVAVASPAPKGAGSNYFAQMIKELEEAGQEGLEMGFGVFPMVSLDKGEFKVGDEDIGRDDFEGVPLFSKPKFAYRTTGVPEKEVEAVYADSDKEHLDPNSITSARLLEWKEKWPDSGWEVKKYQDVYMYVTNMPAQPELEGQIVQLSVAPTSVKHYTRACITAKGKGREAHECVFRVSVGEKVRGEFDYYPWAFKAIGSCQKFGIEITFGKGVDEDF